MKCLRFMGIFLDVNDVDMTNNKNFGMWYLRDCKSYVAVNLLSLFRPENYGQKKVRKNYISILDRIYHMKASYLSYEFSMRNKTNSFCSYILNKCCIL